ncbi:MAG: DUF3289 family protein [Spirochaetaceae bacterium]|jgi:hypothetical protein|nr:DUF3289 family protein [Spirochaetaceae bacterium]
MSSLKEFDYPRRLIQYEAKGEDIRYDQYWVSMKNGVPRHTKGFSPGVDLKPAYTEAQIKVSKLKNDEVKAAIKKDLALSEETLIERFKDLARKTAFSSASMKANNLAMIDVFIQKTLNEGALKIDSQPREFATLSRAAFNSVEGKAFVAEVESAFKSLIAEQVAGNRDIHDWESLPSESIDRPSFSGSSHFLDGLKFAVNNVYEYDVQVHGLKDCGGRTYEADIEYILYDHFGLDYNDIDKFGTTELIEKNLHRFVQKLKSRSDQSADRAVEGVVFGSVCAGFVMEACKKEEKKEYGKCAGYAALAVLTGIASVYMLVGSVCSSIADVEKVAPGFRAWFILQHCYPGYRPFVTVMRRRKTFRFTL